MPSGALWALLLFLPCSVQALFGSSNETDFWAEFGNNFATDLAPIISLFGEQVTKQFLSESTTILDTVIFAVGPLGIITAIVSCIRVSGSSFLKSVVGRAREPRAVPEVELCSSTSESVCELWSNGGICRVFGRPRILEFIFLDGVREFAPFPNLALNVGVQKAQTSILTLWLAAVFGLSIQGSFFWYTNWATWKHPKFYEGEKLPNVRLFFALTIAGTASINLGMALCAKLIDRNSKEQRIALSRVKGTEKARLPEYRMFWLQPGGQRIGDQEFDAFACNEVKTEYIASWNDREAPVPILFVWLGVGLSFVGWMVQFIGLRGQHATVSLYQLCCTIVMSTIRASIRSSRSTPRNELEYHSEELRGHELDWQAFQLTECFLQESHGPEPDQTTERSSSDQANQRVSFDPRIGDTLKGRFYWILQSFVPRNIAATEISGRDATMKVGDNVAVALTRYSRIREEALMGWIESDSSGFFSLAWDDGTDLEKLLRKTEERKPNSSPPNMEIDTRKIALRLKNALQKSSQLLYPAQEEYVRSLIWSTGCHLTVDKYYQDPDMPICFCLRNTDTGWTIDGNQLEAVLGLWLWSFDRYIHSWGQILAEWIRRRRRKSIVIPREDTGAIGFVLEQWRLSKYVVNSDAISHDLTLTNLSVSNMVLFDDGNKAERKRFRYELDLGRVLSIDATSSLLQLMAQDLFTTFVETIGTLRLGHLENVTVSRNSGSDTTETAMVEGMIQSLISEGLATPNEATMSVVPALCPRSGDPGSAQTQHLLLSHAILLKRRQKFSESQEVVKTLAKLSSPKIKARADAFLYEAYRSELRWMVHQRQTLTNREFLERRKKMFMDMRVFEVADDVRWLSHVYMNAIDWLLWSNSITPAFLNDYHSSKEGSALKSLLPLFGPLVPLDKQTLDDLNLDGTESRKDALELALIFDQRYSLGESSVQVRRQLLRWAIESDFTGLVEDLWFAERNNPWVESAFSGGSDELFWAASLRTDSHDMINTIQFLLEVVEMDQHASLKGREDMDQSWWETSRKRDLVKAKYEQVSNVLAAASANHHGRDVVELLAYDLDQRKEVDTRHVCEAVRSALEYGCLETLDCLMTKVAEWQRLSWNPQSGLLHIIAEWGLKQQAETIFQRFALLKEAQWQQERAKEVFGADKNRLVVLREEG
ncbi:hypothetical protein NCS57_00534200 [Fusarium keratoplasticum]|uniref:Uncharacterized protein n=1 Tax=Fusarium keratoplasticum TaxID=1328300 RepID=A0ACC0QYE5_9HYPO|nr:hypothetical protein NCS57_00534200 [Fusarium keratoplasticum]KAI8670620.1 hypothetical protein NCS57_00534200 [Fusarium keratoplasticum]